METGSHSFRQEQRTTAIATGPLSTPHLYDEDAYNLWRNLKSCPEFNECKREIFACIKAPADIFTYFYYLRTNPKAREFTDALRMSIHFVPPERVWNAIVQIRRYPKYSSIRNLVLFEMTNNELTSSQPDVIKRESDTSQKSWAHLSAISSTSAATSRISTNASFTLLEKVDELDSARCSHSTEKGLPELPMAPGKGYRKAPVGHCFVCPLKECKGKWAYKRSGDYLNHMRNVHPSFPPHDPNNYLRKDLRVSTTPIEVKGETMEDVSATACSDSPHESYPDLHALSDAPTISSEASGNGNDFENLTGALPMNFLGIPDMPDTYSHHEARPLFGEIVGVSHFHLDALQPQQSFFRPDDNMETG